MGYSLTIGQAQIEFDREEGTCMIVAEGFTNDDAPAFGEPTDKTSSRWPSYSAWRDFTRFVGLEAMFYDENEGLLREHPGVFIINNSHRERIDEAMKFLKEKYPNATASMPQGDLLKMKPDPNWPTENSHMARLNWLQYWVNWSLNNIPIPVIQNS